MNRMERMTAILLYLQEKPRTSIDIARHFEVSKRTVLRDVQALSEMGVPVIAREGAGGGYALPDDYALDPLPLSAHEAFLLMLALSSFNQISATPFSGERISLTAKLQAILPRQHIAQAEELLERVNIGMPQRPGPVPYLEELIYATHQGRWLKIDYQSADRLSSIHIQPRRLYVENGFWYLLAYCQERAAARTYRVDRMLTLNAVEEDFKPSMPAPERSYSDVSNPQIIVQLTRRGVSRLESDPNLWQFIQKQPDGSGRLDFHCPPDEMDWYARLIAGLGQEADVESPPELRQKLLEIGVKLVDRYKKR